jgi:hypothetical protein
LGRGKLDGPGYVQLGVLVEDIGRVVPVTELDQFRGPDPPAGAQKGNRIDVSILRTNTTKSITTPVVFAVMPFLPMGISGHEPEYFATMIRADKRSEDAWKAFVAEMRSGFELGRIEIGGQALSHNLTVEFSGKGIEPVIEQLMKFVGQ